MIQLADQVVDAVRSGAIKKFVAMAACDDRVKDRSYYTEFTENLPQDVGCRSVQPLPAFLSPNVAKVLTENFGIAGIETVEEDLNILV